jgi:hypothetical protein
MSGFVPVQVPDFGATLGRAQSYGINQLAALAQMRQMQQQEGRDNALVQFGPALAHADPQQRLAALAGLARYMPDTALPLIQRERESAEWNGTPAPDTAPRSAAQGGPMATPVAVPGDGALPRGFRNNNPLNIEAGNFTQGLPGFQGSDGRFARFASMDQGLAAADKLLESYGARGLNTPLAIISRWAPAGDGNNNPQAYAATVARQMGVAPDAPLDMSSPEVRRRLAVAMAQVENGRPLPDSDTTLTAGGMPGGAGPELPEVPGFDMARVRRAMNMPNNSLAQKYLESYYKAAQVLLRTETMPRSPARFQQDLTIAQTSAPRNTVTTNVTNAGDRETDKLVAEQWNQLEQAVTQSGRTNVLLDRGARALEAYQPGVLAEKRIWLGQLAREMGLRSNASEGEMLRAVQRNLELAVTPRGQGAITENERSLIRDQVNILTSTPEAARETMKLIRSLNDYDARIATIYRDNARRNGGRPDPVSVREEVSAFVQANPPPDAQAALSPYLTPAEVDATPRVPAPGGGIASPPPNIPPPPGGGRIIMPGAR